jgi:hypothetical protein
MQTTSHDLFTNPHTGDTLVSFEEDHVPESQRPTKERLLVQIYNLPSHTQFEWVDENTCVIMDENRYYECNLWGSA